VEIYAKRTSFTKLYMATMRIGPFQSTLTSIR